MASVVSVPGLSSAMAPTVVALEITGAATSMDVNVLGCAADEAWVAPQAITLTTKSPACEAGPEIVVDAPANPVVVPPPAQVGFVPSVVYTSFVSVKLDVVEM